MVEGLERLDCLLWVERGGVGAILVVGVSGFKIAKG